MADVHEFEYRCPVNSQPNSTPAMNRGGASELVSAMPDFASFSSAAAERDGSTAAAGATASFSRVNAVLLTFCELLSRVELW